LSRALRALLPLPALAFGLAACSGTATLSAEEVANGAEDALEQEVGQRPDITCPDDVEAKVGNETRCTLTAEGLPGEYGVSVKITSVEGDTANFDVQVDSEPQG
jgi:hypothetical protein